MAVSPSPNSQVSLLCLFAWRVPGLVFSLSKLYESFTLEFSVQRKQSVKKYGSWFSVLILVGILRILAPHRQSTLKFWLWKWGSCCSVELLFGFYFVCRPFKVVVEPAVLAWLDNAVGSEEVSFELLEQKSAHFLVLGWSVLVTSAVSTARLTALASWRLSYSVRLCESFSCDFAGIHLPAELFTIAPFVGFSRCLGLACKIAWPGQV